MGYDPSVRASDLARDPAARAVVDRYIPGALDQPIVQHLRFVTLEMLARTPTLALDDEQLGGMWQDLADLDTAPPAPRPVAAAGSPSPDYEPESVERASATLRPVHAAEQWGVAEVVLDGPEHGNPFVDVGLTATFSHEHLADVEVGGFYDGTGLYRVRFQPQTVGEWRFETHSTARSLDGVRGRLSVTPPGPGNHGIVSVADTFHFAHRDGTRHVPIGTTAYAWTHQPDALEERTLATLAGAPFRKLRMCVFPKSYLFNTNDPPRYPFVRDRNGDSDFTRFDPGFFRHLEHRIEQLAETGIEVDLILFHAYDRWGFSEMPASVDDRYVEYVVRRLGAHRNVWWSIANEYDLLPSKSTADWERIASVVGRNDHVGHLTSIHNCNGFYDHSRPWITHVSAQRTDLYRTAENVDVWREEYGKPVVVDECAYEGDIDQGWGNISGEELVRRFWEGAMRGGYVGHGETYLNEREELWWSKGGELVGDSPARIGFLLDTVDGAPGGVLEPLPGEWDARWAGSDAYRLVYFGFGRPRYRDLAMPPGRLWTVEVLDTWNMTVDRLPGLYGGFFRVPLPGRPYIALRLEARSADDVALPV